MSDEPKALTHKQQVFVDEYLKCWNAAESARLAGYSAKTAREQGYDLLRQPHISSQIEARLADVHMSADEALKLTADIARGDMAQLMDVSSVGFNLDMVKAQQAGLTKLIKKVKQKTTTFIAKKESEEDREITELEIELYSAHEALRDVLKVHGKFTERVDLSNSDGSLTTPPLPDEERLARMKQLAAVIADEVKKG